MRLSVRWLCLLLLGLCTPLFAAEEFAEIQARIVSFKLDNGLTIILYKRGDAPVVSCVTHVQTGSTDEHVGITGIAHQLEHLAFKGTPFIGTNAYEKEVAAFKDLDAMYAKVQAFEQRMPAGLRNDFLSLIAKVTTTGGPAEGVRAQVDAALKASAPAWSAAGLNLNDAEKKELIDLVVSFAEKVKYAEQYVEQNQYSNIIDRSGGSGLNAYTSADQTVYHVSLPASMIELWAALESDRFMNTVPRQLEKEKQVVLEERRMRTEDAAWGKLYETFLSVAFQSHPYGVGVIGHRSDILGYTRDKIMRFYREHYTPQNTVVALVGNFDVDATKKILTEYFSRIPKAPDAEPNVTVEPPQSGERRVEIEFPAQPAMMMGFHIPERRHPDSAALMVLDSVATSGRTSRMYSRLVKTKKANSVGSWLGPGERYPRLFMFSAEPSEGVTPDALETALLEEIEKLKTEAPSAEELARVRTLYRSSMMRGLRSNLGMAQQLANYQALLGDWRELFKEIGHVSAVTPEQCTAVARKYLTRQNRTIARIVKSEETAGTPTLFGVPLKN